MKGFDEADAVRRSERFKRKLNWHMEDKDGTDNRTTVSVANVESTSSVSSLAAKENPRFNSRVDIHIHSLRKRLTDADGCSAKAVIDQLVADQILADDSPEFVREVRFSQEKTKGEEKTLVTIKTI
jgi:hypothetical protein